MTEMVEPLDWVEDLLAWTPPGTISNNLPLMNYKKDKLEENEREIMVCHDMMGGYLDQEKDAGCLVPSDSNPYVFLNWWNIDIFCYFSHHFVTIPPAGYVNTAHKHGCLVMGTFITEWTPGIGKCNKLFDNEETMEKAVHNLVDIAEYYHFDGWLINIENKLTSEQLPMMCNFLQLLTASMRSRLGRSRVIWYDSVILNGSLIWQNELNPLNKSFYDCCDGIYLNYNWTDEKLLNSTDFGLLSRIFVGVDVFGRGCIGGWDCYKPFSRAALLRMSLAIFAPGWVTEKFPREDPIQINLKFWRLLRETSVTRPIVELPIFTNFSAGFSTENNEKWFNLNDIAIQPHYYGNDFHPLPDGGLFFRYKGKYRIFYFDLPEKEITLEVESESEVDVQLNEEEAPWNNKKQAKMTLALKTVDIIIFEENTVIKSVHIY